MTEFSFGKNPQARAIRLGGILSARAVMTISVVALGAALQINFGQYHPIAIQLLTVSLGAAALAIFKMHDRSVTLPRVEDDRILPGVLAAAIFFQFAMLLLARPTAQPMAAGDLLTFRIGILLAAGLSPLLLGGPRVRVIAMGLIPFLYFLIGLWVLRHVPPPPVDICVFQKDACRALLHGTNPYSIDFPNLYANPSKMYDASVVANGRLHFGFPYPPLSLLLTLPGYLAGDFRLVHLAAMSIAGAMIMHMGSGRVAALAGMLFLFTPRSFFIVEAGFTEPLVVLLLAAVLLAACRQWRCLPILFGLLLASKQYMILAAPLGLMLFPDGPLSLRERVRARGNSEEPSSAQAMSFASSHPPGPLPGGEGAMRRATKPWLIAFVTACIVTLPLALWSLPAFMKSVAFLQFHQPMRADSLSYLPTLINYTGWRPLLAIPFVMAFTLIVLFLRRLPRTPVAFAAGLAGLFFVFFATNKQAFCGYYLVVIAGLCISIAARGEEKTILQNEN